MMSVPTNFIVKYTLKHLLILSIFVSEMHTERKQLVINNCKIVIDFRYFKNAKYLNVCIKKATL